MGARRGVGVGVGIAAAGPIVPALFTSDSNTAAAAEGPLRLVAALQPLNAAVFVGDGVLQGAADFDYLAMAMAAAAAPALISLAAVGTGGGGEAVEGTAGLMGATGLAGVWRSMAALQGTSGDARGEILERRRTGVPPERRSERERRGRRRRRRRRVTRIFIFATVRTPSESNHSFHRVWLREDSRPLGALGVFASAVARHRDAPPPTSPPILRSS